MLLWDQFGKQREENEPYREQAEFIYGKKEM